MSNQSVIKYTPCFKKAELVRVKLKTVTLKQEELCVTFNDGGVELLLYVLEDFAIAMEALGINKTQFDDWKKYFRKVLGHGPLEKWKKLNLRANFYTNVVVNNVVTSFGFDVMIKDFIKLYCTSTDPKGDVIKYLKTDKCQKPHNKSVTN